MSRAEPAGVQIRPDEQQNAAEAEKEAGRRSARHLLAAAEHRLHRHHPERRRGQDDRREPARHVLLGPDDHAIAKPNHQHAEKHQPRPLADAGQWRSARAQGRGDEQPRGGPADATHQHRWDSLERDANPEVGRSPDDRRPPSTRPTRREARAS